MSLRTLIFASLLIALSACTTSYRWAQPGVETPRGAPSKTVVKDRWAHLFVFGLIGRSAVDLRDVCPGPVAEELRTGITVTTALVSLVTLGVYTPLEYRFSCVVPESPAPMPPLEDTPPEATSWEPTEEDDSGATETDDAETPELEDTIDDPENIETDEFEGARLEDAPRQGPASPRAALRSPLEAPRPKPRAS